MPPPTYQNVNELLGWAVGAWALTVVGFVSLFILLSKLKVIQEKGLGWGPMPLSGAVATGGSGAPPTRP